MSFEFTLLDALQALRCPVLDALAVFFDQAGARGEIWIAFTAVLLAFRRTRRAGLAMGDVGDYTFICDMVQKTLDTFGQIDVLIRHREPITSYLWSHG